MALHDPYAGTEELAPSRARVPAITYETAAAMKRPRRCYVESWRAGGRLCCDLCTSQAFTRDGRGVACLSSDEPRLFRPRARKGWRG